MPHIIEKQSQTLLNLFLYEWGFPHLLFSQLVFTNILKSHNSTADQSVKGAANRNWEQSREEIGCKWKIEMKGDISKKKKRKKIKGRAQWTDHCGHSQLLGSLSLLAAVWRIPNGWQLLTIAKWWHHVRVHWRAVSWLITVLYSESGFQYL